MSTRHPIDPKIDCVFKALLGAEDNRALLIHFLNAPLGAKLPAPAPAPAVEILNSYNECEFLDDKLSIVDVKARDACGSPRSRSRCWSILTELSKFATREVETEEQRWLKLFPGP